MVQRGGLRGSARGSRRGAEIGKGEWLPLGCVGLGLCLCGKGRAPRYAQMGEGERRVTGMLGRGGRGRSGTAYEGAKVSEGGWRPPRMGHVRPFVARKGYVENGRSQNRSSHSIETMGGGRGGRGRSNKGGQVIINLLGQYFSCIPSPSSLPCPAPLLNRASGDPFRWVARLLELRQFSDRDLKRFHLVRILSLCTMPIHSKSSPEFRPARLTDDAPLPGTRSPLPSERPLAVALPHQLPHPFL